MDRVTEDEERCNGQGDIGEGDMEVTVDVKDDAMDRVSS